MAPVPSADGTEVPPRNARSKPAQDDVASALARVATLPRARGRVAPAKPSGNSAGTTAAVTPLHNAPTPSAKIPRKTARIAVAGALPPARIPPEALASPRRGRLFATALAISLMLHAIAAAIHFSPFDLSRFADKDAPLEVALVNAKSTTKPTKADILAQANLDGGGNTDQKRRAKSPLPLVPKETPAKNVTAAAQPVEAKQVERPELITQMNAQAVAPAQPAPNETPEPTDSPTANELMQKVLEVVRLEAQIAKDWDAYQKRPKRKYLGARSEEYRFARYVEDWRLKIERVGNLNYPEAARQQKLYGSLLLTVSIRSDGSLDNVEVNRTSGQRILDAAAVKIVQMSAPFAAFPPDIKRDTDIMHITRTWTFAKGDELTSQ